MTRRRSSPFAAALLLSLLLGACVPAAERAGEPGPAGAPEPAEAAAYEFPPEFAPQESIWLAWPTYENKRGLPTEPLITEIVAKVAPHVEVDLMAQDEAEIESIRARFERQDVPHDHVTFHAIPHGDVWLRDMGPIFLKGPRGLAIADFNFNVWGYEDPASAGSRLEERVDRLVAEALDLPTIRTDLISEGGNREVNGHGVLMVTAAVLEQRNPDWTRAEMEEELKSILGQEKVIWLQEGMAEDDLTFRGTLPGGVFTTITTGGHVDEFARFADPHTILFAEITEEEAAEDPIAAISRERLQRNLEILEGERCIDGEPFRIVRVPVPDPLFATMSAGDGVFDYIQPLEYEDGTVIEPDDEITVIYASSYLNFHITSGAILAQVYGREDRPRRMRDKDEEAMRILAEAFPGREILRFHPDAVNLGGGGIHCIIQQQPALE